MTALWALFLGLQVLSAGHINYQQGAGYHEINPAYHVFGDRCPSKEQVYLIKGIEIGAIWGATKMFPEHEKTILTIASTVTVCFMAGDTMNGISLEFRY